MTGLMMRRIVFGHFGSRFLVVTKSNSTVGAPTETLRSLESLVATANKIENNSRKWSNG